MNTTFVRPAICRTTIIGLLFLILHSSQAATFRTVALTRQLAPGVDGKLLTAFGPPAINNSGDTAFRASVSGKSGIWSERQGTLGLVTLTDMTAPGLGADVKFSDFSRPPEFNDAGQSAFYAFLAGPGVDSTNDLSIWTDRDGTLQLVMREGDSAPGTSAGVRFADTIHRDRDLILNAVGEAAFYMNLTGEGIDFTNMAGIWAGQSGGMRIVARTGSAAPGIESGTYSSDFFPPAFNNAGQTAFFARLSGPNINDLNRGSIWSEAGGILHLVARAGENAPGTDYRFGSLLGYYSPVINDFGKTAFNAQLVGSQGAVSSDYGIWVDEGNSLRIVVRTGMAAPGTGPNHFFASCYGPQIDNAGQITFVGQITGTGVTTANDLGIWSEHDSELILVAREGDAAPGTENGVTFRDIRMPSRNRLGHTAFFAYLAGNGVNSSNDAGIWAEGPNGIELIVRTGQRLEVSPGVVRTITDLDFVGFNTDSSGWWRGFNDRDQLAFRAIFQFNVSGIFVADIHGVPEPTSLCLTAVFAGALFASRHRRDMFILSISPL